MKESKFAARAQIEELRDELEDLSRKIHANPELAYEEAQASSWLSAFLKAQGFEIQLGVGGMPTAFVASMSGKNQGPTVAFLAEYDALPRIGHGCGHNLIGVGAAGAAAGIAKVMPEMSGTIKVIGTPAEEFTEGKAGKIRLLEEGAFSGVDICLMFHPWTETGVALSDLGFIILDVAFHGKPAHAAADPWNGLNALDAVVLSYNGVSALRQQMKPDARLHCIITHGGDAVNVIPELASLRLMFRSPDGSYLEELSAKVQNCAQGAALATGSAVNIQKVTHVQSSRFNPVLFKVAEQNMSTMGEKLSQIPFWGASSDFGNVSQSIASLSFLVKTHDAGINWHSRKVAEGATSGQAHAAMICAAKVMAMSGIDLLENPSLMHSATKAPQKFEPSGPGETPA